MNLKNVCIILVEPQGPLNIGSICRTMMNFGMFDLRLVNPQTDHLSGEAKRMAVKADSVLENAQIFSDLKSALKNCNIAVATTARLGKFREDILSPENGAKKLSLLPDASKTAVVFGREDRGLKTRELELCNFFITLPTSDDYPSMNLAQAAAICLYEIRKKALEEKDENIDPGIVPASSGEVEEVYSHFRKTLINIGFLDPKNPDRIFRTFRRILGRSGLFSRDVRIIHGFLKHVDRLIK